MGGLKAYWKEKLLRWERRRYASLALLMPSSWTVRRRMRKAVLLVLEKMPANSRILDLGCGSGVLASRLKGRYARFVGVDFVGEAIVQARARGLPNTEFVEADINENGLQRAFAEGEYDLVILLGVVDWLTEEETAKLFLALRAKNVLFSYTRVARERFFLTRVYELYRWVMDSKQDGAGIFARSHQAEFFAALGRRAGYEVATELSEALNPGRLVWWRRQ